jgi:hypothetical protein
MPTHAHVSPSAATSVRHDAISQTIWGTLAHRNAQEVNSWVDANIKTPEEMKRALAALLLAVRHLLHEDAKGGRR